MKEKDLFQEQKCISVAFSHTEDKGSFQWDRRTNPLVLAARKLDWWHIVRWRRNFILMAAFWESVICAAALSPHKQELSAICMFQLGCHKKRVAPGRQFITGPQACLPWWMTFWKASVPSIITLGDPQSTSPMIRLQLKVAVSAETETPETRLQPLTFAGFSFLFTRSYEDGNAHEYYVLSAFPLPILLLLPIWLTL